MEVNSSDDFKYTQLEKNSPEESSNASKGCISPGGLMSGIFNLVNLTIGLAVFVIPFIFCNLSFVTGMICITISCVLNLWTFYLLIISSHRHQLYSYSLLVKKLYSDGYLLFLDITTMVYLYGVLIVYQVVFYEMIGGMVFDLGNYTDYKDAHSFRKHSFWNNPEFKYSIMFGLVVLVLIPLCLRNNMSKHRITSLMGICSFIIVIIVIIVQTPFYNTDYNEVIYKENDESTHIKYFEISITSHNWYFFKGVTSLFYLYSVQYGAFPVMNSLDDSKKTLPNLKKVVIGGIAFATILFYIVGLCGFFSVPINTPTIIIERYKLFDSDIIMTIARGLFVITIFTKLPVLYNSLRLSIVTCFWRTTEISKLKNLLLTIPIMLSTCLISILYIDIGNYISLLGAFCSVIISYIFPTLIYVRSNDYHIYHWKNLTTIGITIVLTVIGIISGVLIFIDIVNGINLIF